MDILSSSRMEATMWCSCTTTFLIILWTIARDVGSWANKKRNSPAVLAPLPFLAVIRSQSDRWSCLIAATLDFGSKVWVLACCSFFELYCVPDHCLVVLECPSINPGFPSLFKRVFHVPDFFPFLFRSMEMQSCPIAWASRFCIWTSQFCPLLAQRVGEVF